MITAASERIHKNVYALKKKVPGAAPWGPSSKKERKMNMKKAIALLLALVMMLSLAACGAPAEPTTDNVVTVWAWDEAFNIKAANEAAAIYKTINPDVTVEVVTMAQDDIVQKLKIGRAHV